MCIIVEVVSLIGRMRGRNNSSRNCGTSPAKLRNWGRGTKIAGETAAAYAHMSHQSSEASLSYLNLPHKSQLLVLAICRFAEPVASTSIYPYLYYMIRSYDVAPERIPFIAGLVSASFNFGQFLTGVLWGQLSDKYGRKPMLLCGLIGTMITSLSFGFSTTLWMVILSRTASGLLNGNVGVLRTMVAELVREKEYQARAFTIMPMVFNIGSVIGPMIGGWLAEPSEKYGWTIWESYPYALPNVVATVFLAFSLAAGIFFLDETLELTEMKDSTQYVALRDEEDLQSIVERPGIPSLFNWQIMHPMIAYTIGCFHNTIFEQLFPVYLSTPRPVGLALSTNQVGFALTVVGLLSIIFQLLVFPPVVARIGTIKALRYCLLPSPITYSLIPILPKMQWYWLGILFLFSLQMIMRTFAFPSYNILITNSAPAHGLGITNGVSQAAASLARCTGPLIAGAVFGNVGGGMWFGVAGLGVIAVVQSWFVKEPP